MEGGRRFESPKKKVFPIAEDLAFYVNEMSRARLEERKRQDELQSRMTAAAQPLTVRERTVLATQIGDGEIMPLMSDALEEMDDAIAKFDTQIHILDQGKKDIAEGRVPKWAFVELFDKLREDDELKLKGRVVRLHALRYRHADGEHLSEEELADLNRLPSEVESEKERLMRLRERSQTFHDVYRAEAIHPESTQKDRRAYLERKLTPVPEKTRHHLDAPVLPPINGPEMEA